MPEELPNDAATSRRLLQQGRFVTAWQVLAPHFAAGMQAAAPAFLQLAHDVCWRIGSDRRRFWVSRRSWRRHRGQAWAWNQRLFDLIRHGRAFAAWELLRDPARPAPANGDEALHLEIATARLLADLRDFDGAQAALQRAMAIDPASPMLLRERAWTALEQDDTAAALAWCREGRQRWPDEPLLRELECWLLLQGQDQAATFAALAATTAAIESPPIEFVFGQALFDAGRLVEARDRLVRLLADAPLERPVRAATTMLLARIWRTLGDDQQALACLQAAGAAMRKWADRQRAFVASGAAPGSGRVVLPVPYVRQDHVTCSPATMASLVAHAGIPIDQREIAAQITYDGTPSHAEMEWAHGRGLSIWFFQFDPAVARELIDRGLPFAITTRGEQSGHRQALIGYDLALGTFLLRDPGRRDVVEIDAEWLTRSIQSRGGDCALVLPQEQGTRVPVERLPLQAETMAYQELRRAYERRDLARAEVLAQQLLAGPPSVVRWEAEGRIAQERADRRRNLELWREAYAAHADDPYWQYHYAVELRAQDRWQQFRELLEQHVGSGSPYLAMLLADHLRFAAPTRAQAEWLARRAIRALPRRPSAVALLADVAWDDVPRREFAAAAYRLASCLDAFDENRANAFFLACVHLGEPERGLEHLRQRVATLGKRRSQPGATLAAALDQLHRRVEAVATMRQALAVHEDPQVRERLFDLLLADSQHAAAAELLANPSLWRPWTFQQATYRLATARGDRALANAALTAAAAIDGAQAELQVTRLRAILTDHGRAAALAEAGKVVAAHGDDPGLLVAISDFYGDLEERALAEQLLRRLVQEHPQEWWLQGRLARMLVRSNRAEQAQPLIAQLLEQTPDSLAVRLDAVDMAQALGDRAAAVRHADLAAERWAASAAVLSRRRGLAASPAEAAAAVRAAMAAMLAAARPPDGADLDYVVDAGREDLTVDDVRTFLEQLQSRFAGQPAVAAARCRFLREDDPVAAVEVGERLVADFPWLRGYWLLQAGCLRAANRRDDERALLERLIEREPGLGQAYVELGESLEQEGRTQAAMAAYDRGLQRAADYSTLHGMRANLAWALGDRATAIAAVDRAATLAPDYAWARRMQVLYRSECGDHDGALAAAEACVRDNPAWSQAHELLATALARVGRHDDRLQALRAALRCEPRLGSARSQLLSALIELRRYDDAEAVIAEGLALHGDDPELLLRRIEIVRARSESVAARAQLRELLAAHPDFERGWSRLLSWLDEERLDDEILAVHRQPPACMQENPTLQGYAADVLARRADWPGAERALRRALALAPGYDWARDRLAEILLEQKRPAQLLELFVGADDPAQVPFHRAALLAQAAAATQQAERAVACFERLLHEPEADPDTLRKVDVALLALDRRGQRQRVQRALAASASARAAWRHENGLVVLASRADRAFWPALTAFVAWVPAASRELAIGRLLYAAKKFLPTRAIARWAAANLRPPVVDTEAWGRFAYALASDRGNRLLVDLTAGNFRRPGVRGWMLANLASAYSELKRWDDVVAVCEFALAEVPQDHSVWWHRRHLAEVAYVRGEFARCRELCVMPIEEFPTTKLKVAAFSTLADLAELRGYWQRRRRLSAALPEILRLWRLADAERLNDTVELPWREFCKRVPSLRSLLFACGGVGRWLLARLP